MMKTQPQLFRFRDHLPKNGEGKQPRAEVAASVDDSGVAKLYLYDVIDSWGGFWGTSASEFAAALDGLDDGVTELHLHVNSPGGEVFEAIAIKNLLAAHPAKVVAVVDGIAASAASFIAVAADELVMGENTELMIHDALAIAYGNAGDFRTYADRLDQVSNNIAAIYAKRTDGTADDWRAVMIDERWYSADEAVEAGLADRVASDEQSDSGSPEDSLAAAFEAGLQAVGAKYANRTEAPAPETPEASTDPEPQSDPATSPGAGLQLRHRLNSLR